MTNIDEILSLYPEISPSRNNLIFRNQYGKYPYLKILKGLLKLFFGRSNLHRRSITCAKSKAIPFSNFKTLQNSSAHSFKQKSKSCYLKRYKHISEREKYYLCVKKTH